MAEQADAIVLGGGAAGLMCAITAGRLGRQVRVVEHANRCGKKILMSGGGRCNFTNTGTGPGNFLSANPHFCKSALARYTPWQFLELVERHGIAWHEKELGQLFCDQSSKQIVAMLLAECAAAGVRVDTGCSVEAVEHGPGGFLVRTSRGDLRAGALVVATGGLSIPRMGATGFGYALARQFGHAVLPTRAGLVPLTLSGTHLEHFQGLAGVALPVSASVEPAGAHRMRDPATPVAHAMRSCRTSPDGNRPHRGQVFSHDMLITHRGVSGPAILQISSYWEPGQALRLDLLPGSDALVWLHEQRDARPAAELRTVLGERLPKRLAQRLCELWLGSRPMRQYNEPELRAIAGRLHEFALVPSGSEGYRTAEVTLGGVDTDGLSSSSMESRRVPGLYFIGEVVDVTGWLGGYNFQWAWASGHAAGTHLGTRPRAA